MRYSHYCDLPQGARGLQSRFCFSQMMMMRAAVSGRQLCKLAGVASRGVCSTPATGNSVSDLISSIKTSDSSSFAVGGLAKLKAEIQPFYPPAAKDEGLSLNAQVAVAGIAAYTLYKAGVHASSPDWIVDLSLDVLQSAWWISFLSFLPFRSIYVSLRGMAPHTAGPLSALKPAVLLKP